MIRKMIGFEYEYLTDRSPRSLSRYFGPNKLMQHDYGCEYFSSIRDFRNGLNLEECVETRTIPMPMTAGIKHLRSFLHKMKDKRIATTEETGLHVGISTANPWLALMVDPADLILLFDDLKWLRHFNRQDLEICKPFWHKIKDTERYRYRTNSRTYRWYMAHKNKVKGIDDFRKNIEVSEEKYSSINFNKIWENLPELIASEYGYDKDCFDGFWTDVEEFKREYGYYPVPYWEIRICGGKGYENEFKAILELIKEFSTAVDKCILNTGEKEIKRRIIDLMGGEKWKGPSVPH